MLFPSKIKCATHYIVFVALTLVFGMVIGIISTMRGTDILGLALTAFFAFGVLVWFGFRGYSIRLQCLLWIAFTVRLALTLTHTYIFPLPDSGADAITFERLGWQIAETWLIGDTSPPLKGAFLYSKVIGLLYYVFGRVPLIPQLVNVLLGTGIVLVVYKVVVLMTDSPKLGLMGGWVAALFPTMNLYSAILLRENTVILCSAFSFLCFMKWMQRGSKNGFLWAWVFLLLATTLHGGMIVIGMAYVSIVLFYRPKAQQWSISLSGVLLGVGFLGLVMVLINVVGTNKLPSSMRLLLDPEYLGSRVSVSARDRAAYLVGLMPTTKWELVLQTPIRAFHFLYTPFVWNVSSAADLLGLADAFMYLILSVYFVLGLKWLRENERAEYVLSLLFFFSLLVAFAWGTSNYGTAIRHRHKLAWLMIAVGAVGLEFRRDGCFHRKSITNGS